MRDRKFIGDQPARYARRGVSQDPIEDELAAAFVIVVAVALFVVGQGSAGLIWTNVSSCLELVLRTAGS